jgi:glyoxylase-like metal-dependent hydrolase (beta-lactamase superfamily II)
MPANVIKVGPLGPYANNAYVIVDGATQQALLVDAPIGSDRAIRATKGTAVQRVVVTHRHGDHWAEIDLVREKLRAPVYCHEADRAPYDAKVDGTVEDGDVIAVGGSTVHVLHTPGHTPGSICLLVEATGGPVLISGDTLFPGGPGRSDSPQALREMVQSITSKLLTLPEGTRVLAGHGDDTTIAASKREYQAFASREHPDDLCGDVTWEGS